MQYLETVDTNSSVDLDEHWGKKCYGRYAIVFCSVDKGLLVVAMTVMAEKRCSSLRHWKTEGKLVRQWAAQSESHRASKQLLQPIRILL